jgi:predicted nucleic acid-binding protein
LSTFVDTSAIMAVFDADDPQHQAARREWDNLMDTGEPVLTSSYVVVETISLLHHRFGIPAVNRFLTDMLPAVMIEWVDEAVHSVGVSALLASGKRGPSLVDCVSFEVMRRLDVRTAFSYDKHFADAGFSTLPSVS